MKAIIVIAYFSGIIVTYFLYRKSTKWHGYDWTIGDRKVAIFISLFSWVAVISTLIEMEIYNITTKKNNDKHAKW